MSGCSSLICLLTRAKCRHCCLLSGPASVPCWGLSGVACHVSAWLQAAGAADTAIQLCILIKRAHVLWEGIYPRYLARKQQGILLERLLPHILASKLPSFPPEVMQANTHWILVSSLHHINLSKCHGTTPRRIATDGTLHTIPNNRGICSCNLFGQSVDMHSMINWYAP